MGLFQSIESEARKRELQFLVIGGLAVNFQQTMPWRRTRPGEQERRLAEKISAEFIL